MTDTTLFTNGLFLDVERGTYREGDLRVDDGVISEAGPALRVSPDARRVDLGGACVLPGLIDSHVHIMASTADLADLARWPVTYNAHRAARLLGEMLDRGFTTVRDMAGGDHGTWRALEEGVIRGPRLFYAGRALSQTGGHGDRRGPGEHFLDTHPGCCELSIVVDGADQVRRAARDELRRGAHHTIEHGNLLDAATAAVFVETRAYLVMNLVTYWALHTEGRAFGLPEASWRKVGDLLDAGLRALELAQASGIKVGYGTDLLGGMHRHQSQEFAIRSEVQAPIDVIRSATTIGAEIVGMPGKLGTLAPGALADLVAFTRDPLEDVAALGDPEAIRYVVKGGAVELSR